MKDGNRWRFPDWEPILAAIGAFSAALGLAVLCGYYIGSLRIVEVEPGLPPMPPMTAVSFLCLGSALLAFTQGRHLPSIVLASATAGFQLLALTGHITGMALDINPVIRVSGRFISPPPAAPNSALAFLALSIALLLKNVGAAFPGHSFVLALLGSLATAFAFTSLVGYVIGVRTFEWRGATPMALHTAIGLLALGVAVLTFVWRNERFGVWAPSWFFLSVTVAGVVFTLSVWQILRVETARPVMLPGTSPLPTVVLVTGLSLSLLLGAAVFLAQQSAAREGQRRQAERELDQFFALSSEMLGVGGTDGVFRRVNSAFERTLGYSKAELLSQPYLNFVVPEDRERTIAATQQLAEGETLTSFENRFRARDGSIRWMQWVAGPIPGRPLFFASARDVTETKNAQQALRRAHDELEDRVRERTVALQAINEALTRSEARIDALNQQLQKRVADLTTANQELEAFTYSVSHDLRAPLRHVDGFSKILLDDFADRLPAGARPLLDRVREGSQRMGRMIDELLQLSRTARREPEKRVTGLRSLVDEVIADSSAETAGRELDWRIGDLPFLDCDPALVRQIFANLLSNALKFTRPRKPALIEVGCLEQAGEKVLFVRDNGVGFSMKYADKLFGAFQRLHRQEDFEGTGVGLATVQRIVHKHGGRIWAESSLDQGATFYFTLGPGEPAAGQNPQPAETLEVTHVTTGSRDSAGRR
jgi:PAS domain S-box-containing protein